MYLQLFLKNRLSIEHKTSKFHKMKLVLQNFHRMRIVIIADLQYNAFEIHFVRSSCSGDATTFFDNRYLGNIDIEIR